MKKPIALSLLLLLSLSLAAQKFAYVNTQYILEKIPEYKQAKQQLDEYSKQYQQEIEQLYQQVDELYRQYQKDKVLLSEEMRRKREEEIVELENKAKALQKQYFGQDGELFKRRKELVQPIQDQVYENVQKIAEQRNYAIIFDTAAGAVVLYSNPQYDKSDEVLKEMGYR